MLRRVRGPRQAGGARAGVGEWRLLHRGGRAAVNPAPGPGSWVGSRRPWDHEHKAAASDRVPLQTPGWDGHQSRCPHGTGAAADAHTGRTAVWGQTSRAAWGSAGKADPPPRWGEERAAARAWWGLGCYGCWSGKELGVPETACSPPLPCSGPFLSKLPCWLPLGVQGGFRKHGGDYRLVLGSEGVSA